MASTVPAKPMAPWMVHQLSLRQSSEVTTELPLPSATPYVEPAKTKKVPSVEVKKSLEVAFNDLEVDEETPVVNEPVMPKGSHSVSLKDFGRLKDNRRRGINGNVPPVPKASDTIPDYRDLGRYEREKHNPSASTRRFGGREDYQPAPQRGRSASPVDRKKSRPREEEREGSKKATGFFKRTMSSMSVGDDDDDDDEGVSWQTAEELSAKRFRLNDPCIIVDDDGKERINYQYVRRHAVRVEVPGHRRKIHQEMDREMEYYFKRQLDGKNSVRKERDGEEKDRSRSGLSNRRHNAEASIK